MQWPGCPVTARRARPRILVRGIHCLSGLSAPHFYPVVLHRVLGFMMPEPTVDEIMEKAKQLCRLDGMLWSNLDFLNPVARQIRGTARPAGGRAGKVSEAGADVARHGSPTSAPKLETPLSRPALLQRRSQRMGGRDKLDPISFMRRYQKSGDEDRLSSDIASADLSKSAPSGSSPSLRNLPMFFGRFEEPAEASSPGRTRRLMRR